MIGVNLELAVAILDTLDTVGYMGGGYLELHSGSVVPWTTARVVAEDVQNGKQDSDQLYFINLLFHQLFTFFQFLFSITKCSAD